MLNSKVALFHTSCLLMFCSLGCGSGSGTDVQSGPPTPVSMSGTVTYDRTPVPKGRIEFEPDASQGNQGTAVSVEIVDGKYQASADQRPISGPTVVRIFGYDGNTTADAPDGSELFPPYTTSLDLPRDKLVFYFNVPK